MKKIIFSLTFLLVFPFLSQALEVQTHIISFPDDPITIKKASAFIYEDKYSTKISCELEIATSDQAVKAAQFNFIFYDIFDEYLDTFGGVTRTYIPARLRSYLVWETSIYNARMSYTAIVYLAKVRFETDVVWRQDKDRIAQEIVEATNLLFKKEQLEERKR